MTTAPTLLSTTSTRPTSAAEVLNGLGPCPPRFATPRNLDRPTLGGKVAKVGAGLGRAFMPWQSFVADVAMEVDPITGRYVYRTIVIVVNRQQGKTLIVLTFGVHRCLLGGQRVSYTAQTRNDAKEKLELEHWPIVQASSYGPLARQVRRNGGEGIRWPKQGSFYGLKASTKKTGHGPTINLGIVDEAFAEIDDRRETSMRPAMVTKADAQLIIASAAGDDDSVYLWALVEAGRAREKARLLSGEPGSGVAYFEWSAGEDEDPADPATWWGCMPALGIVHPDGSGITEATIAAEHEATLTKDGRTGRLFKRSYLNLWVPATSDRPRAIDPTSWAAVLVGAVDEDADALERAAAAMAKRDAMKPDAPVVLALDCPPSGRAASIAAVAAGVDGWPVIDLLHQHDGKTWVVPELQRLASRHDVRAVAIDRKSTAWDLAEDIEAAGLHVEQLQLPEATAAFGQFVTAVLEPVTVEVDGLEVERRRVRILDDPRLNEAFDNATTRDLEGGQAWNRKTSAADISPLVAATNAHWCWSRLVRRDSDVDVLNTIW